MSEHHDHGHDGHGHPHGHSHHSSDGAPLEPAVDLSIDDRDLSPAQLGRRNFLRSAGLLGAGVATIGALGISGSTAAAAAERRTVRRTPRGGFQWLAGDHHIHTQHSPDGLYRVVDHVRHANAYGLDWMVITDHGSVAHSKIGVEKVNPEIVAARGVVQGETLVFQGLEWNIPSAEHGTVFVHPGRGEVAVLKEFENTFDGVVKGATKSSPANEALAVAGVHYLANAVEAGKVRDALFLANHPARKGIDSPHEIRGWRDAEPRIAIGMEGAPGHQAAGIPASTPFLDPATGKPFTDAKGNVLAVQPGGALGPGSGRGFYDNSPSADSFPGYPLESYRTFGGFDWMTATVGGLWDSLLSEGKPWWITANSDSHSIWLDSAKRPAGQDTDAYFTANGGYGDPVHGGVPVQTNGDFWPGYYSRTHVGSVNFSYAAVMAGLRAGRAWVDHGGLLESLDVRVRADGEEVPLGSVLTARRGSAVTLTVRIVPAQLPNWAQFVPQLAKVDVIRGTVTGPAKDRDVFTAPGTRVVRSYDVKGQDDEIRISYRLGRVGDEGFYVRLRGSDGKRVAAGLNGAAVDPAGPAMDVLGDADPWNDLWFYTNPIWVLPA
jgi:hypothetical protein